MKKLLVILIILVSIDSHAQTFNPKQLIGTKWQRVESFSDPTIKWEFSKEEIKETVNRAILNKKKMKKLKIIMISLVVLLGGCRKNPIIHQINVDMLTHIPNSIK